MNIAFNTTPLYNGHKTRGIGSYTRSLLYSFDRRDDVNLVQFTNLADIKKPVDAIHYPWFDLFFHTLPITKKFPTVVTIHDLIPLIFPEAYPIGIRAKINFILQKTSLKRCKAIITDSNCSKKDIVSKLNIPTERIFVIPLAADSVFQRIPQSDQLRIKRKFNLPDKFLLYVGEVNYVKNLPFLIKAFKSLKSDPAFSDLKLTLVGGSFLKKAEGMDHPELKSLKETLALIGQLNLNSEVIRLGQVEVGDLVGIYNLAVLYVQPSLYEGFGIPVLEAMACGTPVISSNAASLPEVGGEAAVYFDPKNITQATTILNEVLMSASLRDKLFKMGVKQASRFSWDKVVDQTIKVYEKIK